MPEVHNVTYKHAHVASTHTTLTANAHKNSSSIQLANHYFEQSCLLLITSTFIGNSHATPNK